MKQRPNIFDGDVGAEPASDIGSRESSRLAINTEAPHVTIGLQCRMAGVTGLMYGGPRSVFG